MVFSLYPVQKLHELPRLLIRTQGCAHLLGVGLGCNG
jgi:hypothetical protein